MKRRTTTKARWRPRQTPGTMNQTEQRFASRLAILQAAGEIVAWHFEPLRIRLGIDWKTTYTPDFMILRPDHTIELADVKGSGGWEDKARVKIKTAAAQFPIFHWTGYVEGPTNHWTRESFNP